MQQGNSIIREDNAIHSFCGLASVGWLYQKIRNSFFLILGTHTCAHFLQYALGVMIFAKPRFAVAMLEEADLSKDYVNLKPILEEIKADHHPSVIFLFSSCTPEVMKVDFEQLARSLSTPELPVLFAPASGLEFAFSQSEDSVLQALLPLCPVAAPHDKRVVFLGSINDATAEDFRREAEALGIPVAGFLPANYLHELPPIGAGTVVAPLQPYLAKVATRLSRERGAKVLSSLFPFGPDGTRQFWEDLAKEFGITLDLREREAAAWERIKTHTELLKGRRVFITADSLLELPLARFLKNAGANIAEVSSVYINKKFHAKELEQLSAVRIVEQPNFHRQVSDMQVQPPDLVITSLMTANPLIGKGITVKWSMEFVLMPLHGWSGTVSLAELLTRPLLRKAHLPKFDSALWTLNAMPSST
ncbi:MAG: ferredoxin:protochlorophyllide reductase (ATP-dependent) subunit N [[Chlorobium] sp. 445]|nr:MAG: ferredoxin:protochlorophyllide reductase (ATP-dependent) subunit N [[Chlorobium] sp. 445]